MPVSAKKLEYRDKLFSYLNTYQKILLITVDNVTSSQLQGIRMALRPTKSAVLLGKNTTIRRCLRDFLEQNPGHPCKVLQSQINGNFGFIFTNADVKAIRGIIAEHVVPAPARVGAIAPSDVWIEPGPTGCDPGQTKWFQDLQVPTKIVKGQIEIVSRIHLIKVGEKVGESEAALLIKLNYRPFSYGAKCVTVYDNGSLYDPVVLDLSADMLLQKFHSGVRAVAALSLAIGYPTKASLVHSINNAFKRLVAVSVGTDYTFPKAQAFKDFLADPSKWVVASAPAAGGAAAGATAAAAAADEESDAGSVAAAGLFGGGGDDDW